MKELMKRGLGFSPAQFLALVGGNPFRKIDLERLPILTTREALEIIGGHPMTLIPDHSAKIPDTFTAAHAAKASAQAQADTAERLNGQLAPFLASCQKAVAEASSAGLTAVDVPCSGLSPQNRLALVRELQARGFAVHDVTTGLTLGWQPAPTPRPPAYRTGQALQPPGFPFSQSGPRDLIPGPHRSQDLLREAPEEVGPPR